MFSTHAPITVRIATPFTRCYAPGFEGGTALTIYGKNNEQTLTATCLLHNLHDLLLLLCWKDRTVNRDTRDANVETLYKNKGDRRDSHFYRYISLLSVVGRVFARVALTILQILNLNMASELEDRQ